MTTMSSLQELQDRLAICELMELYSASVTLRDWDAVGACFHPDARWRASVGYEFRFPGVAAMNWHEGSLREMRATGSTVLLRGVIYAASGNAVRLSLPRAITRMWRLLRGQM